MDLRRSAYSPPSAPCVRSPRSGPRRRDRRLPGDMPELPVGSVMVGRWTHISRGLQVSVLTPDGQLFFPSTRHRRPSSVHGYAGWVVHSRRGQDRIASGVRKPAACPLPGTAGHPPVAPVSHGPAATKEWHIRTVGINQLGIHPDRLEAGARPGAGASGPCA